MLKRNLSFLYIIVAVALDLDSSANPLLSIDLNSSTLAGKSDDVQCLKCYDLNTVTSTQSPCNKQFEVKKCCEKCKSNTTTDNEEMKEACSSPCPTTKSSICGDDKKDGKETDKKDSKKADNKDSKETDSDSTTS